MSFVTSEIENAKCAPLEAFVEFLRIEGSNVDVKACAQRFGYSQSFVRQVLDDLSAPQSEQRSTELFWKSVARAISQVWDVIKSGWFRATNSPYAFVTATTLAAYVFSSVLLILSGVGGTSPPSVNFSEILAWIFLIHFACFIRHGMLRYPLVSAGIVTALGLLSNARAIASGQQLVGLIVEPVALGFMYGFAGSVLALVGGYVGVQRRAGRVHALSRQEALDRLFVIKERLDSMGANLERASGPLNWIDRAQVDPRWPLLAFIGGLTLGALRVLVLGGYTHIFRDITEQDPGFKAISAFSSIFTFLFFTGIGYLSGSIRKAFASQFIAYGGMLTANFIHLGMFGPAFALSELTLPITIRVIPVLLFSGLLAGIGARVEDSAKRKRLLDSNNPASLVAEMVLLQRRLNAASAARCVLCVDVARSTAMKSGQDPLVVEWSFREYQKLVQECADQSAGQVLSTSGDGSVLTYAVCADALLGAREIQTRLNWFNLRVNRLDSPFRVRIGLHADEVQGELEDVQFTRLIDLAAHVQQHAPIGGILVTSAVASQLENEALSELKDPVEDQMVWLIVNPTLGA